MGMRMQPPAAGTRRLTPLAEHIRPITLDQVLGQQHLIGPGKPLRRMVETGQFKSSIIWGPPGVGKTSMVRAACADAKTHFVQLNATETKIDELRKVIKAAGVALQAEQQTVVFVDECLPGDTMIWCLIGGEAAQRRLDEIVLGGAITHVLSQDTEVGVLEWQPIESRSVVDPKPMVEVEFEELGEIFRLRCSEDHLVFTENRGYVQAQHLIEGDTPVLLGKAALQEIYNVSKPLQDL